MVPEIARARSLAVVLLLALIAAAPTSRSETGSGDCEPVLELQDPTGDTWLFGVAATEGIHYEPAVDFISYSLRVEDDSVLLRTVLVEAPPRETDSPSYRYWFGFHIELDDGSIHYLDARAHGKRLYDLAILVAPNAYGNLDWGAVEVNWENETATVVVPLSQIRPHLDQQIVSIGQPEAASDGPFFEPADPLRGMVYGGPYVMDRVSRFPDPYQAVPVCYDEEPAFPASDNEDAGRNLPASRALFLALALLIACGWRRRTAPVF